MPLPLTTVEKCSFLFSDNNVQIFDKVNLGTRNETFSFNSSGAYNYFIYDTDIFPSIDNYSFIINKG